MVRSFIPQRQLNPAVIVGWEKHLLKKHYKFMSVTADSRGLICIGQCTPSEFSVTYTYKVKFTVGDKPRVYAINPKIPYHEDIHMYKDDNRLCLYYPKDFSWTTKSHLYDSIIPWTHEWFVFYELYQLYGRWMHPEVRNNNFKI